jgi:predicted O-methyltransferase YrrM
MRNSVEFVEELTKRVWRKIRKRPAPARQKLAEIAGHLGALLAADERPPPERAIPPSDNRIEILIAEAYRQYGHELEELRWWTRLRTEYAFFPDSGMYDWIEGQVLYLFVRKLKPEHVVEISPNYGYSTGFMLLAMEKNRQGQLFSFDLLPQGHEQTLRTFAAVGVSASRQRFYAGEVRRQLDTIPEHIDLLFMDSDHSPTFAHWYIEALFPRVVVGALIQVHDVLPLGVRPHLGDEGEGEVIWNFLRERSVPETDYLYLNDLMRAQPLKPPILQALTRYPFGYTAVGTNNIEQNNALWMVKTF